MHDRIRPVRCHGNINGPAICQFTLDKDGVRMDRLSMALGEVVIDDDLLAGLNQLIDDHAADVAGAAGDEYFHGSPFVRGDW